MGYVNIITLAGGRTYTKFQQVFIERIPLILKQRVRRVGGTVGVCGYLRNLGHRISVPPETLNVNTF